MADVVRTPDEVRRRTATCSGDQGAALKAQRRLRGRHGRGAPGFRWREAAVPAAPQMRAGNGGAGGRRHAHAGIVARLDTGLVLQRQRKDGHTVGRHRFDVTDPVIGEGPLELRLELALHHAAGRPHPAREAMTRSLEFGARACLTAGITSPRSLASEKCFSSAPRWPPWRARPPGSSTAVSSFRPGVARCRRRRGSTPTRRCRRPVPRRS